MRESRPYGSVRGALRNERPCREQPSAEFARECLRIRLLLHRPTWMVEARPVALITRPGAPILGPRCLISIAGLEAPWPRHQVHVPGQGTAVAF